MLKDYRELGHRGLAGGRPGQGTFVEGTLGRVGVAGQAGLRRSLLDWLREAGQAGLDPDGMAALFTAALQDYTASVAGGQAPRPSKARRPGSQAEERLAELGIPLPRKVGKLSGGQQSQWRGRWTTLSRVIAC